MIQVTQELRAGWCILAVRGRADAEAADQLEEALKEALKQNSKVAADFSGLDYISSAGLRAVLQAARAAETLEAEFAVCRLSPPVKKVFDMSRMHQIMRVHGEIPC